jgi:hypothetical protein
MLTPKMETPFALVVLVGVPLLLVVNDCTGGFEVDIDLEVTREASHSPEDEVYAFPLYCFPNFIG